MPFPRIVPHDDGSGVVVAVGRDVATARVGERVWLYLAQARRPFGPPALRHGRAFGTAAEYVAVPSQLAIPLPERVPFAEASVLGIPAITAHRCIYADGPVEGWTVPVAGGAGSVGQYAIQFAKLGGATVITTVSGPEKADRVRSLGAHHIVDYKRGDAAAEILEITGGDGVDLVCETDFAANLALNAKVLRRQGRINTFGSDSNHTPLVVTSELFGKEAVVRFVYYYMFSDSAFDRAIEAIGTLLECDGLRHPVARRFALADTAAAHLAVEDRQTIGKNVIEIAKLD